MADERAKIRIELDLPYELIQPLLQHIRDFDAQHSEMVKVTIAAHVPNLSTAEIEAILRSIKPPFKVMASSPTGSA